MSQILRFFDGLLNNFVRMMNNLGPNGWAVIAVLVVSIGFVCMRGYGSRSTY